MLKKMPFRYGKLFSKFHNCCFVFVLWVERFNVSEKSTVSKLKSGNFDFSPCILVVFYNNFNVVDSF